MTELGARRISSWSLAPRLSSALLLALLPKCPFCWAGYAAVAASLGLNVQTSYQWLVGALYVAGGVGIACLWRLRSRLGAALATLGAAGLVAARMIEAAPLVAQAGVVVLIVGLLVSMLGGRRKASGVGPIPVGATRAACCD